ncbi:MAG: 16S rRNA (cytosine(1402)-N(4))-methyltransferase RsmH [Phycisphaera sp.]|nr:16S rRNA (cytosine(1402)-N(4))-methyltransferase RsmH [Phycisphaera sp.]
MVEAGHIPVLPRQVLELLSPQPGQVCVDCTLGRAGHAAMIAPRLGPTGVYVGLDADPRNLDYARSVLEALPDAHRPRLLLLHGNFANLTTLLASLNIPKTDLLLADLGFASNQMDDPERGFSMRQDGPLDMRLDPTTDTTAADLVNTLSERELADVIYKYGEERMSRRIARNIVEERGQSPIVLTRQLAQVVHRALGIPTPEVSNKDREGTQPEHRRRWKGKTDPATRTFMALRIAVNAELDVLERLLDQLPTVLVPGGRAAVIAFHSLEDRIVKHRYADWKRERLANVLTKKPLTADDEEQQTNPRSRSAKLRAIEWIGGGLKNQIGN